MLVFQGRVQCLWRKAPAGQRLFSPLIAFIGATWRFTGGHNGNHDAFLQVTLWFLHLGNRWHLSTSPTSENLIPGLWHSTDPLPDSRAVMSAWLIYTFCLILDVMERWPHPVSSKESPCHDEQSKLFPAAFLVTQSGEWRSQLPSAALQEDVTAVRDPNQPLLSPVALCALAAWAESWVYIYLSFRSYLRV